MQFIFSTGSLYSYSVARCFDLAAQSGFDGLELMVDQRWDTRQADYLLGLIKQHNLPILAVHSPFSPNIPNWPADEVGRIQKSVALAEALGAGVVVHHLPPRVGWVWLQVGSYRLQVPVFDQRANTAYCRWLKETYADYQANTSVKLCIENLPARQILGRRINAFRWNTVEQIVRFPDLTLDTTHLGTWGIDPIDAYPHLQDRVRHIHLSNFNGHEHRRPEDGHLALDRLLAHLTSTGFTGTISLELHPNALDAGSPDKRVVELLTTSLNHCRDWAG